MDNHYSKEFKRKYWELFKQSIENTMFDSDIFNDRFGVVIILYVAIYGELKAAHNLEQFEFVKKFFEKKINEIFSTIAKHETRFQKEVILN